MTKCRLVMPAGLEREREREREREMSLINLPQSLLPLLFFCFSSLYSSPSRGTSYEAACALVTYDSI